MRYIIYGLSIFAFCIGYIAHLCGWPEQNILFLTVGVFTLSMLVYFNAFEWLAYLLGFATLESLKMARSIPDRVKNFTEIDSTPIPPTETPFKKIKKEVNDYDLSQFQILDLPKKTTDKIKNPQVRHLPTGQIIDLSKDMDHPVPNFAGWHKRIKEKARNVIRAKQNTNTMYQLGSTLDLTGGRKHPFPEQATI